MSKLFVIVWTLCWGLVDTNNFFSTHINPQIIPTVIAILISIGIYALVGIGIVCLVNEVKQ